jgi:hypothetical protein
MACLTVMEVVSGPGVKSKGSRRGTVPDETRRLFYWRSPSQRQWDARRGWRVRVSVRAEHTPAADNAPGFESM